MSRYIDKDKLIAFLTSSTGQYATCEDCCDTDCVDCIREEVIKNFSEADVVEVVRCKDCVWWEKQSDSLQGRCCLFVNHFMYPTGSWYCANSKRKKDEE